jgi:transcriptional regulator with XRE-family HTH domain
MRLDGQAVEWARHDRNLSREKLARLADTSTRTIVRIEREGADPGVGIVARLAVALDVPLESLFTENGAAA